MIDIAFAWHVLKLLPATRTRSNWIQGTAKHCVVLHAMLTYCQLYTLEVRVNKLKIVDHVDILLPARRFKLRCHLPASCVMRDLLSQRLKLWLCMRQNVPESRPRQNLSARAECVPARRTIASDKTPCDGGTN